MADFVDAYYQMVRGRHLKIRWTVKDRAAADAAQDITSYASFRWTAKDRVADADAAIVFTKTVGSGLAKTTPLSGIVDGTLSPSDTTGLAAGIAHTLEYELECVDDDAESFSLERGIIEVLPDVDRA